MIKFQRKKLRERTDTHLKKWRKFHKVERHNSSDETDENKSTSRYTVLKFERQSKDKTPTVSKSQKKKKPTIYKESEFVFSNNPWSLHLFVPHSYVPLLPMNSGHISFEERHLYPWVAIVKWHVLGIQEVIYCFLLNVSLIRLTEVKAVAFIPRFSGEGLLKDWRTWTLNSNSHDSGKVT